MVFHIILFSLLFLTLSPQVWLKRKGNRAFIGWQILRLFIGLGYSSLVFYVKLADHTPSAYFSHFSWVLALLLIIDFAQNNKDSVLAVGAFIGIGIILVNAYLLLIYPMTIASDKYEVALAEVSDQKLEPMNEERLPIVPRKYARYKAEKILGKVENYFYYDLGESTIQKIDNRLYWITPLEYKGFFRWWKGKEIPGYIQVSAEDHRAEAQFIEAPMKYTPSAWLGDNLIRRVRQAHPDMIFHGISFEPDENGKPYYVVTYGNYHNYRSVREVEGAILVDPSNGKIKTYPLAQVPAFVDRVIPEEMAFERNEWFGKYKHGFFNSIFGKRDVHLPTAWENEHVDEVIAVFDRDLNMYWFTDHTRAEEDSGAMVGYSMMETRTGKMTYYMGANGLLNGKAAANVVEKTFREKQWKGANPVLYNIFGQYTWVVTALDSNGVFRQVMLVNAADEKVTGAGDAKGEAINNYQYVITSELENDDATPTQSATLTKQTGKVIAVYKNSRSDGQVVVQFMIEDDPRIYSLQSSKFPYAVFLEKGHKVEFEYLDTKQTTVSVKSFVNKELGR